MKQPTWTLKELARQSTLFLTEDGQSQRITWKPNPRQIRYYTTLGLLDRPFGGRGYGNTYGPKHLLQLLSIKQLQHQGLKLAEIQPMIAGMPEKKLAELLRFDLQWLEKLTSEQTPDSDRQESAFWEQVPPISQNKNATEPQKKKPSLPTIRKTQTFVHLELQPGITLVVEESQINGMTPVQQARLAKDMNAVWQSHHREDPTSL